jgi:pimeloyl-ACP methyl ester carboxylesterase
MARSRFRGAELLATGSSRECVDEYYAATLWSWQAGAGQLDSTAQELANQSLARLLHEGVSRGRLDLQRGLEVNHAGGVNRIPIETIGLPWESQDFHELRVVGRYYHRDVTNYHTTRGVGVPVVMLRHKPAAAPHTADFLPKTTAFSATAVLTPDGSTLRLYDPLRFKKDVFDGIETQLATDTTADLVYSLNYHPQTRIEDFLRPDSSRDPSELYFLEPYQPNKVPVIFVHGLLSSPDAWVNIINELRTHPEIGETYQFWAFKYATGAPFIRAASDLRNQLDAVIQQYGMKDEHKLLYRSVMIGHSMGGLITMLSIAYSGEDLWNSIAYLPIEAVATDEAMRARLTERLYFDPHPMISRTIFIATPHQGSIAAGRVCGKVASALINNDDSSFEQLLEDNIGGFRDSVASGLPTSIDMLDPKQPFLASIGRLPLNGCVPKHTILGNKYHLAGHHSSDGIVSVISAQHREAISEKQIAASHNGLLKHRETYEELLRILRLHIADSEPIPNSGD